MHVFLIFDDAPNLVASCCICTASSRVGAKTRTIGPSPGADYIEWTCQDYPSQWPLKVQTTGNEG